jgi:hypothetical protein
MKKKAELIRNMTLLVAFTILYLVIDIAVQKTGYLQFGSYVGLKSFLPPVLGILWGPVGVLGTCAGCMISTAVLHNGIREMCGEIAANIIMGIGAWELWHTFSGTHRIQLKTIKLYLKYIAMMIVLSICCGIAGYLIIGRDAALPLAMSYFSMGMFVGVPIIILFGSLLGVINTVPARYKMEPDASYILKNTPESIEAGNEVLEETAMANRIKMKKIFEVQSCVEELSLRIFKHFPDVELRIELMYGDAISIRMIYNSKRFNPFKKGADEDEIDLISLNLLKHRALRASSRHSYAAGENQVHVVV